GEDIIAQALFISHARSGLADAVHDRGVIWACHPAPGLRFRRSTHLSICGALGAGIPHVPSPMGGWLHAGVLAPLPAGPMGDGRPVPRCTTTRSGQRAERE
ncbi:hypothetical protein PIB30_072458, partial [Stylosanthes scabra]|nr:hypothetical protein [Stylosanthes scabra]